jgi:hypothetical protein
MREGLIMYDVLVSGQLTNPRQMFRRYGANITRWPKASCPSCKKPVHFYGKPRLILEALGLPLPKSQDNGTANPGFHHYDKQGTNCPRAGNNPERYAELRKTASDEKRPVYDRHLYMQPDVVNHNKAILMKALKIRNYSETLWDSLIAAGNKEKIWDWGFPPMMTAYVLLQNNVFDFRFNNGKKGKVRFVASKYRGEKCLRMVFDNSGSWVRGYTPIMMSEAYERVALAEYNNYRSTAPAWPSHMLTQRPLLPVPSLP